MRRHQFLATAVALCAAGTAGAESASFEFLEYYKNTATLSSAPFQDPNLILRDQFNNGNPALSDLRVDGTTNSYAFISGLQPPVEAGGRLVVTANALTTSPTNSATGQPFYSYGVRLLTNVNEASLITTGPLAGRHNGLSRDTAWSVATVFEAAAPGVGANYSLRLSDFGIGTVAGDGNDILQLSFANVGGTTMIRLSKQDFIAGTITVLDQQALALTPAITRIGLGFGHLDADTDTVHAYYAYGDTASPLTVVALGPTGTVYNGEIHTRAELRVATPVPEPATWAMWAAGLAGLGAAARRSAVSRA